MDGFNDEATVTEEEDFPNIIPVKAMKPSMRTRTRRLLALQSAPLYPDVLLTAWVFADANRSRNPEVFSGLFMHMLAMTTRGLRRKLGDAVRLSI